MVCCFEHCTNNFTDMVAPTMHPQIFNFVPIEDAELTKRCEKKSQKQVTKGKIHVGHALDIQLCNTRVGTMTVGVIGSYQLLHQRAWMNRTLSYSQSTQMQQCLSHCPSMAIKSDGGQCLWACQYQCIGGFRGGVRGHAYPYGSRFFRIDIQNFHNVAALGVHAPLRGSRPPPYGKS